MKAKIANQNDEEDDEDNDIYVEALEDLNLEELNLNPSQARELFHILDQLESERRPSGSESNISSKAEGEE